MPTPPTLVMETETTWSPNTTPKTLTLNVQVGDLVVLIGWENTVSRVGNTPTNSGTAQTWARSKSITPSDAASGWISTATMTATNASMVVTGTSNNSGYWGFNATVWRGSSGLGASASTRGLSIGLPSQTLTTTAGNSAVCVGVVDSYAYQTTRTFRTVNGVAGVEDSYYADLTNYGIHNCHHLDVGAAGANAYGMTSPNTSDWCVMAIEVKGTPSAARVMDPVRHMQAVHRATEW